VRSPGTGSKTGGRQGRARLDVGVDEKTRQPRRGGRAQGTGVGAVVRSPLVDAVDDAHFTGRSSRADRAAVVGPRRSLSPGPRVEATPSRRHGGRGQLVRFCSRGEGNDDTDRLPRRGFKAAARMAETPAARLGRSRDGRHWADVQGGAQAGKVEPVVTQGWRDENRRDLCWPKGGMPMATWRGPPPKRQLGALGGICFRRAPGGEALGAERERLPSHTVGAGGGDPTTCS